MLFKRKKVGLALGGGSGKGFAHIGVIKVLEKNNIPIDMVAGTSIGAMIGALYCAEQNSKKLEKEALGTKWDKLFDYTIPTKGFIKGKKIEKFLKERLGDIEFKDLKIPLYITAFDIEKRREVVFDRGSVAQAVRASISIPGIFVPIENNRHILVDGGVTDPIPTEVIRNKADIVIAVNVVKMQKRTPLFNQKAVLKQGKRSMPNILSSAGRSLQMMSSQLADADILSDKEDLVINVKLDKIGFMDFSKVKYAIKEGEKSARKSIDDLEKLTNPNVFKSFLDELRNIPAIKKVKKEIKEVKKEIKKANR